MTFIGMDPAVVRNVGIQLKTQADQLDAIIAAVDGLVGRALASWKGVDAQQFEGWWQGQHKPALHAAQVAVDGLGQSALNNVSDQERASGTIGAAVATAGGASATVGIVVAASNSTSESSSSTTAPSAQTTATRPASQPADVGPAAPYNSAILNQALSVPPGSNGGECAMFAIDAIRKATGISVTLGSDINRYQASWDKYASPVQPNELQAGDIVQFYDPAGKYPVHTSIITGGNSPANATVIDSNYVGRHIVGTGTLADRAPTYDGKYEIWRIDK